MAKRLKLLHAAKYRSAKTSQPFDLTVDDIVIPEVCPVLGIPLVSGGGGFSPDSPSVDKIDPKKGYVKGNICVISWRANKLKSDATLEELVAVVNYMAEMQGVPDTLRYDHDTGRLMLHTIQEFD
jgi:hypothetical protein